MYEIMIEEHKLALNFQTLRETETRLLFRDEEVEKLLVGMKNGIHTYAYGSIGTGKTLAVRRAIARFNDARNKAIYVSCAFCETEYSVLREIIDQINAMLPQKIFIETRSNYDLVRRLKKERERIPSLRVVVLDHLQALEQAKIVDYLLEIGFTIILISDEPKAINKLSALSQSYFANTIHFSDWTREQIIKLLHSKARHLLGEGCYKESLITKIAQLCVGNIGYGESLLLASALNAVNHKKDDVDETDIPETQPKTEELSHDEKIILEVLTEHRSLQGGQLYKIYCERTKFPKAERTFRNYAKNLCDKNLVKAIGTNKGRVYELASQ